MTSRIFVLIATSSLLIVSCQSSPQRVNEWKFVGDGEPNLMSVEEECKKRADEEFQRNPDFFQYDSNASMAASFLLYPIVYGIKTDKYFAECMNGRNYANNEEDIKRLKQENSERIAAQEKLKEKSREEAKRAEEASVIRVGDYVVAKLSVLVIYEGNLPDSERIARFDTYEKAKVLNVEEEWLQVEVKNIVGWARRVSIRKINI